MVQHLNHAITQSEPTHALILIITQAVNRFAKKELNYFIKTTIFCQSEKDRVCRACSGTVVYGFHAYLLKKQIGLKKLI